MAKISKDRAVFGLFLLVLIAIGEIVMHHLQVPAWPAFFIMIFFFMAHMDKKLIPNMLVGGSFGILNIISIKLFVLFVMSLGLDKFYGILIYVLVFVYLIVLLGEVVPILFNNYAFMAFLFTATYMQTPDPLSPFILVAIMLVGGGIFILGIQGIFKILEGMAPKKQ